MKLRDNKYKCPYCDYRASDPEYIDGHLQHIGVCPDPIDPTFYFTSEVPGTYGPRVCISPSSLSYKRVIEFLSNVCLFVMARRNSDDWQGFELSLNKPELVRAVRTILTQRFNMIERK